MSFYGLIFGTRIRSSLLDTYDLRVIHDAGSQLNARLSSVIRDRHWYWQAARFANIVNIQGKLSLMRIVDMDDTIRSISKESNSHSSKKKIGFHLHNYLLIFVDLTE
jgi:hypothetical protein